MVFVTAFVGQFLLIGVILAVGITLWAIQQHLRKKRRDRIRAYCDQHGYGFVESSSGHDEAYRSFEPFDQGSRRTARHIVRGERGDADFEVFQYEYTVQQGKSSTTYHKRVAVVQMPLAVASLSLKPEHIGHKIFDALGGEDLDFESDEFSRRFWVRAKDRRQAYDIIHPQMQAWLLQHPTIHLQWKGTALMMVQNGKLEIPHIESMLTVLDGFRERLPRHLLAAKP